jgi:formylglycine-generating enzyme required for sulfatase activity
LSCGAGGYVDSCCTSLEVTGGTFYRTYQYNSGPTAEADPATVSGFRLDKYDVTVGRFRKFVAAWNNGSGYTPPAGSGKHGHLNGGLGLVDSNAAGTTYETGWVTTDNANIAPTDTNLQCNSIFQTWTSAAGSNENLPINCMNWYEAYAFCIWDGGFLPSEAEYVYTQAGGAEQREYPWGTTDPSTPLTNINLFAIYDCYYPSGSPGSCTGGNIAPVGTAYKGAGKWGQLDLSGNVYHWVLDWTAPFAPCIDCADLSSGGPYRMARGGYFAGIWYWLEPSYRPNAGAPPTGRYQFEGFRCARVP